MGGSLGRKQTHMCDFIPGGAGGGGGRACLWRVCEGMGVQGLGLKVVDGRFNDDLLLWSLLAYDL